MTFCGVRNFGNTSAMRVIVFFGNVQNVMQISEMQRKIERKPFVSEILVSELVA